MRWRLGVVGSPIAHSLSPQLHEAGLAAVGLTGESERIEIDESATTEVRTLLRTRDALSVTMPLKVLVAPLCDEFDDVVARTGSVNSLLRRDGKILGASTDGEGFVASIRYDFGREPEGLRVMILGSGGSARALVDALDHHGIDYISIVTRNTTRGTWLKDRYASCELNAPRDDEYDLVVNTIPQNSRGDDSPMVKVNSSTMVVDLGYQQRESPWLASFGERGCRTANGLSMLVHQAQLQMQWWWDRPVPIEPLLKAVA